MMATKPTLDSKMTREARKAGNHTVKKAAVMRKQLEILSLAGTIEYSRDYDYKATGTSTGTPDTFPFGSTLLAERNQRGRPPGVSSELPGRSSG